MIRPSLFHRRTVIGSLLLISGIIIILVTIAILLSPQQSGIVPPKVGEKLYNFAVVDMNGKAVRLSDYYGKPVIINVWATWCPPCQVEMPVLKDYLNNHSNTGLEILALNAGEGLIEVKEFVKQNDISFPVLMDPQEHIINGFQIFDFPTSILIGRDGIVKSIHIGRMTSEMIESEFTPHLSE